MTETLFIVLYGLLFLSGSFMLPAWVRVALDARASGDKDYQAVATALAINALGTIVVFGPRLVFGFWTDNWAYVSGPMGLAVLFGLLFLEVSKVMLMYVRRRHGNVRTWWAFAICSAVWTIFAAAWVLV